MGTVRVLQRHWVLTVLGLLLAIGAAAGTWVRGAPTYTYTSTVLLLPPKISAPPAGTVDDTHGNPLFYLGSLSQSRDILISSLTSSTSQADLATRFPGTAISADADALQSAPVVVITAAGPSAQEAKAAQTYMKSDVPKMLAQVQQGLGVRQSAMITSRTLTSDVVPKVSHKAQIRRAIVAGGAIGLIALFIIALFDNLVPSGWRSGRKSTGPDATATVEPRDPEGEPPADHESSEPERRRRALPKIRSTERNIGGIGDNMQQSAASGDVGEVDETDHHLVRSSTKQR